MFLQGVQFPIPNCPVHVTLQAALAIFGMVGGPQLGLFMLGILYPCTNNKVSNFSKYSISNLQILLSLKKWTTVSTKMLLGARTVPFTQVCQGIGPFLRPERYINVLFSFVVSGCVCRVSDWFSRHHVVGYWGAGLQASHVETSRLHCRLYHRQHHVVCKHDNNNHHDNHGSSCSRQVSLE